MRWLATPPGKVRTRLKFAWLPIRLDDGHMCWIEFYEEVSELRRLGEHPKWVVLSRG